MTEQNQTPDEAPVSEQTPTSPSTASSLFGGDPAPEPETQETQETSESTPPPVGSGSNPDQVQQPTTQAPNAPEQAPVTPSPVQQQPPVQTPPSQHQAAAPQQRQLTQEELNQQLGVYTLSEADYDAVFDTEDKAASIQALNKILQNTARQALVMSNHLLERQKNAIEQEIAPYKQFADSYREQELKHTFFTKHPDLKGQDQLINFVIAELQREGAKFNDNNQVFDEVAKRTKAVVQQLAVQGQGVPQQTVPQQTVQQKPKMAQLSNGGQAGQASNVAKTPGNNTAKSLFA